MAVVSVHCRSLSVYIYIYICIYIYIYIYIYTHLCMRLVFMSLCVCAYISKCPYRQTCMDTCVVAAAHSERKRRKQWANHCRLASTEEPRSHEGAVSTGMRGCPADVCGYPPREVQHVCGRRPSWRVVAVAREHHDKVASYYDLIIAHSIGARMAMSFHISHV